MKTRQRKDEQKYPYTSTNGTNENEVNVTVEPMHGEYWPYNTEEEETSTLAPNVVHSCVPEANGSVDDVVEYVTLENVVKPETIPYQPEISQIKSKQSAI